MYRYDIIHYVKLVTKFSFILLLKGAEIQISQTLE